MVKTTLTPWFDKSIVRYCPKCKHDTVQIPSKYYPADALCLTCGKRVEKVCKLRAY